MSHLVSKQPWGTIDFDKMTGQILVQEDWYYLWRTWPGVSANWTYQEKRAAHTRIDRSIWAVWSNRLALTVRSKSGPPPRFGTRAKINFDVRWVTKPSHWAVTVWKMPASATPTGPHRSFVRSATREIELNTADLAPRGAGNAAGASTASFLTPPHEYGHTLRNPDEYAASSPFISDTTSLLNIGREIRGRHLNLVVEALNRLTPDLVFTA